MDVQEPITNLALVEAIRVLKEEDNITNVNHMIDEMLQARFLSPVQMEVEGGEQHGDMQFFTLQTEDGDRYLMAFTDWEEAHRWRKSGIEQSVVLTFDDYAKLILQEESDLAGFVMNPFHENMPVPRALVKSLKDKKDMLDKRGQNIMKAGEKIRLGEPNEYPKAMMDAIVKHCEQTPSIHATYLRLMQRGERCSWLIMVDFDGEQEHIFEEIAKVARPFIKELMLDMLPIDALGEHTLDHVEPFYQEEGYHKPIIILPSIATVEDCFAMKNGGCVLGCFVQQGGFIVGDQVDVVDLDGKRLFVCHIDGMEMESGRIDSIASDGQQGVRVGILVRSHEKSEFIAGYRLRKTNV